MFDISFSELLVIAVVALIVIGPEKLPKVARTAGAFLGRMQRFVAQIKDEMNREARFAELQHLQQEVKSSLNQGIQEIEHSILPPASTNAVFPADKATPIKKTRQSRAKKNIAANVASDADLIGVEDNTKIARKRTVRVNASAKKANNIDDIKPHAEEKTSSSQSKPRAKQLTKAIPSDTSSS